MIRQIKEYTSLLLGHKTTVFVQGATGNTGSAVISELAQSGRANVIAGVRDATNTKCSQFLRQGVEVRHFDTEKPATLLPALKNVKKLIIIPPNSSDRIDVVLRIVEAAKASESVRHIILLSIIGAPYQSVSFEKQFRTMEIHIEQSGLEYTFLRCSMFMDNYLLMTSEILSGTFSLPLGHGKFSPVAISDVGKALAKASLKIRARNIAYTITGPDALGGEEHARVFSEVLGIDVKYVDAKPEDALEFLKSKGFEEWQAKGLLQLYELVRKGKLGGVYHDLESLTRTCPLNLREFVTTHRDKFLAQ